MKQLKKLTRYHKTRLSKKGLEPDKYGLKYEDNDCFIVVPKNGGDEVRISKK